MSCVHEKTVCGWWERSIPEKRSFCFTKPDLSEPQWLIEVEWNSEKMMLRKWCFVYLLIYLEGQFCSQKCTETGNKGRVGGHVTKVHGQNRTAVIAIVWYESYPVVYQGASAIGLCLSWVVLSIMNTMFKRKDVHKCTWHQKTLFQRSVAHHVIHSDISWTLR